MTLLPYLLCPIPTLQVSVVILWDRACLHGRHVPAVQMREKVHVSTPGAAVATAVPRAGLTAQLAAVDTENRLPGDPTVDMVELRSLWKKRCEEGITFNNLFRIAMTLVIKQEKNREIIPVASYFTSSSIIKWLIALVTFPLKFWSGAQREMH